MTTQNYAKGQVIFREGDPGDCMYEIECGSVGVYRDYGKENENLIAKLYGTTKVNVFGEMGLLDHAPRSATVVALEDNTVLTKVSELDFYAYFEENPSKILDIMQQMCNRLRNTTKKYIDACHTVYDTVETEKRGEKKSLSLLERIKELCDFYGYMGFYPYF